MIWSGPGLRCNITNWASNLGDNGDYRGFFLFIRDALGLNGWGRFLFFLAIGRFSMYFIIGLMQLNSSFSLLIAVPWRAGSLLLAPLCIKLEL